MPINVILQPSNTRFTEVVDCIYPGAVVGVEDYTEGQPPYFYAARCYPDDRGGEVYRFTKAQMMERAERGTYDFDPEELDFLVHVIERGESFRKLIKPEGIGRVLLTFDHYCTTPY